MTRNGAWRISFVSMSIHILRDIMLKLSDNCLKSLDKNIKNYIAFA